MEEYNDNIENRIIESAKRLFSERGYHKTSMSDIASDVGITRPTLHYYFRTKERMFEAVVGLLIQSFIPRIEVIVSEEIHFSEKLEKLVDEYLNIYSENPSLPGFVVSEMQRDSERLLGVMERLDFAGYLGSLSSVLQREVEKGTVREVPPVELIMTFFGLLSMPFLAKNLLEKVLDGESGFEALLVDWRDNIVRQMKVLLCVP